MHGAFKATSHLSGEHPNYKVRMEHLSAGRRLLWSRNTGDWALGECTAQLRVVSLQGHGTKQSLSMSLAEKFAAWTWLNLGLCSVVRSSAWAWPGQPEHMLSCSPWPRGLHVPLSPSCLLFVCIQQQLSRDFQDPFWTPLGGPGLYFTSNA